MALMARSRHPALVSSKFAANMAYFPNMMQTLLHNLQPLFQAIRTAGGSALIVGGAVRDAVLGLQPSDCDIEVYGLAPEALAAAVAPFGRIDAVGRSFGVLKLRQPGGAEIDLAVPQHRSINPLGEIGTMPIPDPTITPREACARRDFTWNAMAMTPAGELLDFFGGQADLQAGVIRHTSEAFDDDPLRVLRAVQFAARFGFRLAPETAARCRTLLPAAASLPAERVWVEWQKWALRSRYPQMGLRTLAESGWLAYYPALAALVGCPQDPAWHPEGDVWVHTGHVCDAAVAIALREGLSAEQREVLLFAALCHDLGKPLTTIMGEDGRIRSPAHAEMGVAPAQALLGQFGAPRRLVDPVLRLVREHMALIHVIPTERAVRRLAVRLAPATILDWRWLIAADASGRPPLRAGDPGARVVAMAASLGAATGKPAAIVTGRHLLDLGYTPGPALGRALRNAYNAQIDGEFADITAGLAWLAHSASNTVSTAIENPSSTTEEADAPR